MADEKQKVADLFGQVWRAPDGAALYVCGGSMVPPYEVRVRDAVQDDRGRWCADETSAQREVSAQWLRTTCTFMPPEPEPPDPRIAHLEQLVNELLIGYAAAATGAVPTPGQVARLSTDVRAAMADVAAIPEQERRRRHAAARMGAARMQRGH